VSERDVANAIRGYAAINDAYRSGDPSSLRPLLEELWHPDCVFTPAGVLPESEPAAGYDGVVRFVGEQMKAFEHGSMWIEPMEYVDGDDVMVVPYRFGGRAAYTGLDVEFTFAHVAFRREGKVARVGVYASKAQALEAAGLAGSSRPIDVVRAAWGAYAAGGLDAMAAFWHPEIEWRAVEGAVDDVGVFRGRDRLRAYYADWLAMFAELTTEVQSVLREDGDVVAVLVATRARPRGTQAWARGSYAVVYTVRDGVVVRGREYPSAQEAVEAVGELSA
jgi:ketosteroid isomerase-like protein